MCIRDSSQPVGLLDKMVKQLDRLHRRNGPVKDIARQQNQIGVFPLHKGQEHPVDKICLIL